MACRAQSNPRGGIRSKKKPLRSHKSSSLFHFDNSWLVSTHVHSSISHRNPSVHQQMSGSAKHAAYSISHLIRDVLTQAATQMTFRTYDKWNESDTKREIPWDPTYTRPLKVTRFRGRKQEGGGQGQDGVPSSAEKMKSPGGGRMVVCGWI